MVSSHMPANASGPLYPFEAKQEQTSAKDANPTIFNQLEVSNPQQLINSLLSFYKKYPSKFYYRGLIEGWHLIPSIFLCNVADFGPKTQDEIKSSILNAISIKYGSTDLQTIQGKVGADPQYKFLIDYLSGNKVPTLELIAWEYLMLHRLIIESFLHGISIYSDLWDAKKSHISFDLKDIYDQGLFTSESWFWQLLSLGRHFGLPTRFLDWTRHPLVALYFGAINSLENKNNDIIIWAVDEAKIKAAGPVDLKQKANLRTLFVEPSGLSNPYAAAQESILSISIYSNIPNLSIEELMCGLDEVDAYKDILIPLKINGDFANEILKILSLPHRIHAKELFPGNDGFIKYINETRYY